MMLLKRTCIIQKEQPQRKRRRYQKNIPDVSKLVTNSSLNLKTGEVENKIPDASKLVTNSDLNTKIREVENMISNHNVNIITKKINESTPRLRKAKSKTSKLSKQK